jgi:hypothetical protein
MIQRLASAAALVWFALVPWAAARAEAWPSVEELASPRFLLIVHCRTEAVEGQVLYKVLDVWKGEYSPRAFVRQPPTGYINTGGPDVANGKAGVEVILCYTRHNQPREGIHAHDMSLLVKEGKLTYPPGIVEFPGGRDYAVEEFKREITSRMIDGSAAPEAGGERGAAEAGRPGVRSVQDLSGPWRMLLPAGFEHAVKLVALEDGRYRLDGEALNSNGVYEVRDKRLVIVEAKEPRYLGFEWEIRSPYLLTLVGQSELEQDYRGAVLFRPRQQPEHREQGETPAFPEQRGRVRSLTAFDETKRAAMTPEQAVASFRQDPEKPCTVEFGVESAGWLDGPLRVDEDPTPPILADWDGRLLNGRKFSLFLTGRAIRGLNDVGIELPPDQPPGLVGPQRLGLLCKHLKGRGVRVTGLIRPTRPAETRTDYYIVVDDPDHFAVND